MGTDYVDLLQFHDPDPKTPIEDSWRTVQELVQKGKVRYPGLSNHSVGLLERAMKIGPVVSSQVQYSPLERRMEREMMPFCLRNNIGVLGWASLAEGFLADNFSLESLDQKDFRRKHQNGQPESYAKIVRVKEALSKVAKKRGKRILDLVIAWELMHQGLTGAIIGIRNETEAQEMLGGVGWKLDSEEIKALDDALKVWER